MRLRVIQTNDVTNVQFPSSNLVDRHDPQRRATRPSTGQPSPSVITAGELVPQYPSICTAAKRPNCVDGHADGSICLDEGAGGDPARLACYAGDSRIRPSSRNVGPASLNAATEISSVARRVPQSSP
jgi:hypothetical protein